MTGLFDFDTPSPSVLIVLMGSLGDVTRGLAVAHQVKSNFPGSKVTWLVEPACKGIVSLNRFVDRVITFNRPANILGLPALWNELRAEKFDVVLDLQRHFKSGVFSLMSGAKTRIGFDPPNAKEFNYLFNTAYIENLPKGSPKLGHYLSFIKKLGKEVIKPLDFGLSMVKEGGRQKEILSQIPRPYAGLILGSSWESKDWPIASYISLVNKIVAGSRLNLALLGDKSQSGIGEKIFGGCTDKARLINFAGKTSLADAVALIDESEFCVGPDSGPGHIAGALGKEYISLFGPTDPSLTAPLGSEHLVIKSNLGCMPCYKRRCPGLGKLCMHLISPEAVFTKIGGLAGGRNHHL